MTCKDCLLCPMCFAVREAGEKDRYAELCPKFKNKADFVEVVRCKGCTFRQPIYESRYTFKGKPAMVCIIHSKAVAEDGYCSYGKRRDT